jgi:uncharacterized protein YeaO (DUF488 family)
MVIRVVRLGSPRAAGEGTRLGTVRRPPRGVPKAQWATQDWYDAWLPNLAPSVETLKRGQQADSPAEWAAFSRAYRREMAAPEADHLLGALAALSQHADFSVGCYCLDESRCHRSLLRELLSAKGARLAPD